MVNIGINVIIITPIVILLIVMVLFFKFVCMYAFEKTGALPSGYLWRARRPRHCSLLGPLRSRPLLPSWVHHRY